MFLSERAAERAEEHAATCNLCLDTQYVQVFTATATHVKSLRAATRGMSDAEASDFITAHLHTATMRTHLAFQEKYNELVQYVSKVETVMTSDQKVELERLKAFDKGVH